MFALTIGELAIVLFIFALVWGAGVLPRLGENLGEWAARRPRGAGATGRSHDPGASGPARSGRDGG